MRAVRQIDTDRAQRHSLQKPSTIRHGRNPLDAFISDISATGFRARVDHSLEIGDRVEVGVGGSRLGAATVVRVERDAVAFAFDVPISEDRLRQIDAGSVVLFGAFQSGCENAANSGRSTGFDPTDLASAVGLSVICVVAVTAGLCMALVAAPFAITRHFLSGGRQKTNSAV